MKRVLVMMSLLASLCCQAQREREYREKDKEKDKEESPKGKQNLFTGGSVSLAFYNNTFLIGGNPVFGYSLTNWTDVGLVVNYTYTAYRDVQQLNDRLRQSVYGGGAFLRLYPVRFLFGQVQLEHNWLRQKYIPSTSGGPNEITKATANSVLVGGGYTTGRWGRGGGPFYYLSVLFDVSGDLNSPYTDGLGRSIPIIRGGIQIPLFQGNQNNNHRRHEPERVHERTDHSI
jgi:hypothetical protein